MITSAYSNQTGTGTASRQPTIWGLTLSELHQRVWAAYGVQVVTPNEQTPLATNAEIYLLTSAPLLVLFPLRSLISTMAWLKPELMWLRIRDRRGRDYRERIVTDDRGRFARIQREYASADVRLDRVALTSNREIAMLWQASPDVLTGWRRLRAVVPRSCRAVRVVSGRTCDIRDDQDAARFIYDLVSLWHRPNATVSRIRKVHQGVWSDDESKVASDATFIGPAWIGAGRSVDARTTVLGPAVFWDAAPTRPAPVLWDDLEPDSVFQQTGSIKRRSSSALAKRIFDVLFAALVLLFTLPFYPLIMLAIYFEDGRPFFFAHERETLHGRRFPCLKFRSMRKDADKVKLQIMRQNQVDGPQFHIDQDPRITRTGRWIRRFHIDEWPQFLNVIVGDMSVVGPRPSPFSENQYCPAWRETRLSVLPGITGLWQVCRTRQKGLDFQEWIKYDVEYVERRSLLLDLSIICRTVVLVLKEFGK